MMKVKNLLMAMISIGAISCGGAGGGSFGSNSPESATEKYVTMIAKADYDKALDISTGPAAESVKQMREAEATGYEMKVIEVTCKTDDEAEIATCKCTERKIDSTATLNYKYDSFVYELEKLDDTWKVSSQTKDMPNMDGLGEMGGMEFGDEDMMDEAPIEPVLDAGESGDGSLQ